MDQAFASGGVDVCACLCVDHCYICVLNFCGCEIILTANFSDLEV